MMKAAQMNGSQAGNGSGCAAENLRLLRRAQWLIALRWIAIVGVLGAGFTAGALFGVPIHQRAVYGSALFLGVYNTLLALSLKRLRDSGEYRSGRAVKFLIDVQILLDLLTLTALLHFAGGVENPFAAYYVFHMAIASVILSVRESYLHAALACLLFTLMALLEYGGLLPHYCIVGGGEASLHDHGVYIAGTVFGLGTTLLLVVYMTSSIAELLKKKERAWREANVQLKQKDRVKDEYVARVTHDIKSDLATIYSCLDVAMATLGDLPENQFDLIRRAHRRTGHLTCFVQDLLRLTRMRLNRSMPKEEFALGDILEKVLAAAAEPAGARSINLQSHVALTDALLLGAPLSIEEAIGNLVRNAIKYTPAGGTVAVRAVEEHDHVRVDVSDTGIGIPAGEINRVFEEFFRASNTRGCPEGGTGLGLSIVRQIVERHGGEIGAVSELGKGATFSVRLPRHVRTESAVCRQSGLPKGASVAATSS